MRMTNIDVSIIIVNYDITSLVVNAIDSLFHKIKDLTIEIIVISNVSNDISPSPKAIVRKMVIFYCWIKRKGRFG